MWRETAENYNEEESTRAYLTNNGGVVNLVQAKRDIMGKRKLLYLLAGMAFLLASCQTGPVPITPGLISYVGPGNVEKFYFYLSKDVTLARNEVYNDSVRFQDGVAIPIERDISEEVVIKRDTPGMVVKNMLTEAAYVTYTKSSNKVQVTIQQNGQVVKQYDADEKTGVTSQAVVSETNPTITYQLLGVSFEEGDGREIGFAVVASNPDGTFDMLFDDEITASVLYEGKLYRALYKGDERPYLMVRLGKGEADRTGGTQRVAKGAGAGARQK
ncbi:MAG: hypothetical protein LBT01_07235 [Spirochaetaceae bacterium]|nr:hypothetical protein [Spirochaetaceae bacterium]